MKRLVTAVLLACAPLFTLADDNVYQFSETDPVMQAAIADARATLPTFMTHVLDLDGTSIGTAALKVEFDVGNAQTEVIWISPFTKAPTGFAGILSNQPNFMTGKNVGDSVAFDIGQIADWSYFANGTLYGNYTTRAMMPHLDAATQAEFSALLAPNPVPSDW